jgi:threonylcarbamoyladenosine tRNA methylthiotransferase MtaB
MIEVAAQARKLAANGYREIVLTGVDITSYGENLADAPKLGALVKRILKDVPEIERLRLSSIDSVEADADLLDAFANEPRLMPHLHLSLQAGDDLTLKRMKRRHARADAVQFCAEARGLRPDMVFGADLIAGFPTETEAMFANSIAHVDECGLTFLHVFPFSPRPGTPAARMPQLNGAVIARRAGELRAHGVAALGQHLAGAQGRRIQVLMENGSGGRAADFTPVRFAEGADANPLSAGMFVDAVVSGHDGSALTAVSCR